MSEENYEFDENGGHKPIRRVDENGKITARIPMLGCGTCEAAFYNAPAREKHLREKHPFKNYGAHPEAIMMARMRPELAEGLGLWGPDSGGGGHLEGWSETYAPMNVKEFMEQQKQADAYHEIEDRKGEIESHPVHRYVNEGLSQISLIHAIARQNAKTDSETQDLDQSREAAEFHLKNLGAYHSIGVSMNGDMKHASELDYHVDNMLNYHENEDHAEKLSVDFNNNLFNIYENSVHNKDE